MTKQQTAAIQALAQDGKDAILGKGGFFIRGEGFVSAAMVYRQYGIRSERVVRGRMGAYGDYATIAMLNGIGR